MNNHEPRTVAAFLSIVNTCIMSKIKKTVIVTAQITVELPKDATHSTEEIVNVLKIKSGDSDIKVLGVVLAD